MCKENKITLSGRNWLFLQVESINEVVAFTANV